MELSRVLSLSVVLAVVFVGVNSQHHYVAPHYIEKTQISGHPYYGFHHTPPIDPYSKYAFGYNSPDPYYPYAGHTREEVKDGPVIKGRYSVVEPTGEKRIVSYVADQYGTNQIVDKGPLPVRDLQPVKFSP